MLPATHTPNAMAAMKALRRRLAVCRDMHRPVTRKLVSALDQTYLQCCIRRTPCCVLVKAVTCHVGATSQNAAHLSAALDEEAVGHLHDVGLVDGVDALAAVVPRVFERVLCHACGGVPGDDLAQQQADYLQGDV